MPVPEMVRTSPDPTVTVSPLVEVNVAVPPVTLILTPHWSGGIPGRHGMTIISTTAAIDTVADSDKRPAKAIALIQECLRITPHLVHKKIFQSQQTTPRNLS
jgi:hypothetical protein